MRKVFWGVVVWSLCLAGSLLAGEGFPPVLFAAEGAHKIIRYGTQGEVVWEHPAEMARDVWALPNSNVLFCVNEGYDSARHDNRSGVLEVTPGNKVVFAFWTTGQVWSCQRMLDGNTLVGASSQGRLLVVNPESKIVKSIQLVSAPGHSCQRNVRELPNGDFLVAEESARAVRQYSPEGKLLREIKVPFAPYSVVRLDGGDTIVCGQQTMVRVDGSGQVVWTLRGADIPEMRIRWFAGIQVLPNGNIFICNAGGGVPFLEVSPERQVVWHSPASMAIPMGHGVHRLDVGGRPRK